MTPAGFHVPAKSPVWQFRMITVLTEWQETAIGLPRHLLWALALHEGDALLAEPETPEIQRFRRLWPEEESLTSAVRLGPGGTLEVSGWFEPGEPLLLWAEVATSEAWFTLRRAAERQPDTELSARALYRLRVEPGYRVVLPPDALWALSLAEGGTMACKTVLWSLEGGYPQGRAGRPVGVVIETGGALRLPEPLHEYAQLQPGSDLRLEVSVSGPKASFRLEPDLSLP